MKLHPISVAVVALALSGAAAFSFGGRGDAAPAPRADAAPVLVELYQSEGCSSCPPAEAWLNGVADRPGLIALSFEVTYWDYLGWKDRFAKPEFTQRQRDYARVTGAGVVTPQFWINGTRTVEGANPGAVQAAIAASRSSAPVPVVTGKSVSIGAGAAPGHPVQVWLARYDPRVVRVPVKAGENDGRTLPHRNLVRELVMLGEWRGAAVSLPIAPGPDGLRNAVFLQDGKGGKVLSAGTS